MEVTKLDLTRADNLIKMLKRGKYELEGEEVLGFAQTFHWVATLKLKIEDELAPKPPAAALAPPTETKVEEPALEPAPVREEPVLVAPPPLKEPAPTAPIRRRYK